MQRQIILASVSPRRRELMKLLKIKFKVVDSGYEEIMHKHLSPQELVKFLALGKAKAAAKKYPKAVIIAADTLVSDKGKAIGKPIDRNDAVKMLKNFSGRSHLVFTAAVVLDAQSKKILKADFTTKVYFKKLTSKSINQYLAFNEAYDKAGGYGPLGASLRFLLKKIEGDGTTQFGLPLMFVSNALIKLGALV